MPGGQQDMHRSWLHLSDYGGYSGPTEIKQSFSDKKYTYKGCSPVKKCQRAGILVVQVLTGVYRKMVLGLAKC